MQRGSGWEALARPQTRACVEAGLLAPVTDGWASGRWRRIGIRRSSPQKGPFAYGLSFEEVAERVVEKHT
eukprot:2011914-Lingulodinium_polyedra.AAC.1